MKPKINPFHRMSLPLALLALAVSQSVQAVDTATTQWIGGDISNPSNWGTPGNWIGAGAVAGGPNSASLSVLFNSTFANQPQLGAAKIAQGIWLADGVGQDVTINASVSSAVLTITGTATLNGQTNAGIIMTDSANHNLTIGPKASILLSNNTGFYNQESSASTLTISGGLNLNGKILTIGAGTSSTGNVAISGNITSASGGSITVNTAGTVTLSGTNTYPGTTNIGRGTLVAGNVAALGGSLTAGVFISTTSGAGTLQLSTDTSVNAYTIRSSSANQGTIVSDLATAGAGITHVLGTAHLGGNTYHITKGSNVTSGTAAVSFASINVAGSAGSTTKLNPTTADLLVTGAVNIASANGNKTLELGGTSQGSAISGVISDNSNGATGTLSLTKSGAGTWTLTGVNTYTGVTTINGGILQIGNGTGDGSISTSSGIVNNGSLQFNIVTDRSYSNIISGGGTVTQTGPGTQTLSGSNTYTGVTTISDGALSVGSTANLGAASSGLVFDGGVLQVTGNTLTSFSGIGHTVSFNATKTVGLDINSSGNTFTVDSVLNQTTGGFTKLGAGTAVLDQANTFAGNTSVNAGSLVLANSNALQNSTLNVSGTGAAIVFSQTVASHAFNVGGLTSNGAIALQDNASTPNAVTLTIGSNNANTTSAGVLSGNGGLIKTGIGTLTLSGNNSFTGATVVSNGTLRLGRSTLPTGLNIMPMGDSITYGDHGSDAGYRGPLYNLLNPVAPGFNYVGSLTTFQANISLPAGYLHHEGHSGWTAAQLTTGNFLASGNGIDPNVILLQIGTNDLLSYGGGYTAQLKTDLETLLTQLTTNRPDANIILANITPTTKRTGVAEYNAMVNTVAAEFQAAGKHVTVVDNNTYFPASGLADGTHPDDSGYTWLANQWYGALFTLYSAGGTSNALIGSATVTVDAGATLDVNNNVATIGALGGAGSVTLGGGALTISSSSAGNNSTFSGVISGPGSVTKTGASTLTLSGMNTYTGGTTVIAGTLALGASNVLPGTPVSIGTATLNTATFNDTVGTLDVTGSAVINLGSGGALAFADSSAINWTGGTLTITGNYVSGSSLRFGTTSSSLTSTQLALISKPGGGAVTLDSNGYLIDVAGGYASWAATYGFVGGPDAVGADGIKNLVKYALGLNNPTASYPSPGTFSGGLLSFTKGSEAVTAGEVNYSIETSTDLAIWTPATDDISHPYINNSTTISYQLPSGSGKRFAHLVVTLTP